MDKGKKKMPFFSIIIPVYNAEKYVAECLDSVCEQTFGDYEVIAVDDGSIDNSYEICNEYARKDTRIHIFKKNNGGAADARNYGIKRAQGNYLLFLDSDDYWSNSCMLDELNKICLAEPEDDIMVFGATLQDCNGNRIEEKRNYQRENIERGSLDGLMYQIRTQNIIGSVCTKIIKKDYLKNNGLYFKVGIKCEDIDWIIRSAVTLPQYRFVDKAYYVYRVGREGSVTSTINEKHIRDYISIIKDAVQNDTWNVLTKDCILHYVAYQYIILCAHTVKIQNRSVRNELLRELSQYKGLFEYRLNPKVELVSKLYRIVGFRLTVFMLGQYLLHR